MRVCKCVHSATEMSVTANSKNHPTQQSAAALPIKRYAAAYGVHPLDRPARSPRRPPSIHSSRQTQPHPAPRCPKRKFVSKSAGRQKMRASEHGWAAYAQLPLEPLTARPMRSASGGTMYLYESPQGPPGRFQKILQHGKKMRVSDHGWAALRLAILDYTVPVPENQAGAGVAVPTKSQMRRTW